MPKAEEDARRDATATADQYRGAIAEAEQVIRDSRGQEEFVVWGHFAAYSCRVGLAHYSLGSDVRTCQKWFGRVADEYVKELKDIGHKLHGNLALMQQLEFFAAGCLAGRAEDMVAAYRKCEFTSRTVPRVIGQLEQFHALILGEPLEQPPAVLADIMKGAKAWAKMPALFRATADQDPAFDDLLLHHLNKVWKPEIRPANLDAVGWWCLHAAVLCRLAGRTPIVPKPLVRYLPTDLIPA